MPDEKWPPSGTGGGQRDKAPAVRGTTAAAAAGDTPHVWAGSGGTPGHALSQPPTHPPTPPGRVAPPPIPPTYRAPTRPHPSLTAHPATRRRPLPTMA